MSNINKFSVREWLAPPVLLPIAFCAAGRRCDAYSVVVSTSADPRHQLSQMLVRSDKTKQVIVS
jgi:hypothetical protein